MATNSEQAEHFTAAFNRQDLDAFVETLHPEIEIHGMKGVFKGREQAREWATRKPGGVQQTVVIDELREGGDNVVALIRRQWHWDGTDELAREDEMAMLFTLRDGLIVRWQPFEERESALRAAGLPD